ncbi:MAG: hypothetical protein ACOC1J_03150, partial [Prolixibacteraceae bacterium]
MAIFWVAGSYLFFKVSEFSDLPASPKVTPMEIVLSIPAAVVSYVGYIIKLFYPVNLAPARLLPSFYPTVWQMITSIVLLAGITGVVLYWAGKGRRYVAMGWFWFLIVMLPGVIVNSLKHNLATDRYAYVGIIGIFIMVVWGAKEIFSNLRLKKYIIFAGCLMVFSALAVMSWSQSRHWQNRVSL